MNAELFATWLRRQGYRVYRTASSYWYEAGPRVLQAFPFHWLITPEKSETDMLMLQHAIVAVRYSSPLEPLKGRVSYHVILRQPYDLEKLKSQARNGVKDGLAHFQIEQISFERLATEGWALQQDTLARQDRLRSMSQEGWERLCRAGIGLSGFEAWAATYDGRLAGALIVCRIDDVFDVPYAMSHSDFLGDHVNNALFYAVSHELLARPGIKGIFYTIQSLDAPPNVDEFKFRMGLAPVPISQMVAFHPLIRPFVTPAVHDWVARSLKRDTASPLLAKTEGMLRLHLEGRRAVAEQAWPSCIASRKESLLQATQAVPGAEADGQVMVAETGDCEFPHVRVLSAEEAATVRQPEHEAQPEASAAWKPRMKRWFRRAYVLAAQWIGRSSQRIPARDFTSAAPVTNGEVVRVRSREEILASLNQFKELKGYRFLPQMSEYFGTEQRVLKSTHQLTGEVEGGSDRPDGAVLLENCFCKGTASPIPCDHCCLLYWREEWLERAPAGQSPINAN